MKSHRASCFGPQQRFNHNRVAILQTPASQFFYPMRQHFKAYQFCKGPKAAAKLGKLARVSSDVKNMFGRIVIYAKPFQRQWDFWNT